MKGRLPSWRRNMTRWLFIFSFCSNTSVPVEVITHFYPAFHRTSLPTALRAQWIQDQPGQLKMKMMKMKTKKERTKRMRKRMTTTSRLHRNGKRPQVLFMPYYSTILNSSSWKPRSNGTRTYVYLMFLRCTVLCAFFVKLTQHILSLRFSSGSSLFLPYCVTI